MVRRAKFLLACSVIIGLAVCVAPRFLNAGGDFSKSLRQKLSAPSNIQYNSNTAGEQYEPYYLESQQVGQSLQMQTVNAPVAFTEAEKKQILQRKDKNEAGVKPRPAEPSPFASFAIYKTDYQAEIEENVVTVRGNIFFEVFQKGWNKIPLVRNNVGLIDVSINKGASFVTMQGGKYYLMIDRPGRYNLALEFLIKAQRERENGPGSFNFDCIPAPISQFEFSMPESGVEIFVDPAIKLELKKEPKKTVAWAVMPNTETIAVRWTKALPKEEIVAVKLEPKIYVDTATYASIGEGLIRSRTLLNYSILQSEVSNLRIGLPEDVSVLEVQGKDLRDWKVTQKEGTQYLDAYLSFATKGNYTLTINYERKIGDGSQVAQVPWVRALGVEREKGYFGLAATTNVELAVNKTEQVTLIDVKELPSSIWSSTTSPLLLAFKYLNQPFSIAIEVTKHEELPVLVAVIDSAEYTTLQTNEGKSLTKAVFQVRNNVKQYIHLSMPKDTTLWSVFVAGKPVKPAKDKNGATLIPLEKSQLSGEVLTQFPVEIVYLGQSPKLGFLGKLNLDLPKTDIPVSTLRWDMYLPLEYVYLKVGGNMKPGKNVSSFGDGVTGMMVQSRMKSAVSVSQQYDARWAQESASPELAKGVLPIKINVPQEGRLLTFSKLLVTEKEDVNLSFAFIKVFKQLKLLINLSIAAVCVMLLLAGLRKLFGKK